MRIVRKLAKPQASVVLPELKAARAMAEPTERCWIDVAVQELEQVHKQFGLGAQQQKPQ